MTKVRKTLIAVLGIVCAIALSFGVYELLKTPGVSAFADDGGDQGVYYADNSLLCSRCGSETVVVVTIDATCQYDGFTTYVCTTCYWSEQTGDRVAALGHNYEAQELAATCTEDGYYTLVCSRCGDIDMASSYIEPAAGHSWVEAVTSPTCYKEGYTTRTCSKCGTTEIPEDSITPAREHNLVMETVSPTCDSYGYTVTYCAYSDCDYSKTDDWVDPLGHNYKSETVLSGVSGLPFSYTIFTCTYCGYSYIGNFNSSGDDSYLHSVLSYTVEATCETAGYTYNWCEDPDCDWYTITDYVPATGHNYVYVDSISATCTTPGYLVKHCNNEGCTVDTDYEIFQDALGHDYVFPSVVVDRAKGTITGSYYCKNCGDDLSEDLVVKFIDETGDVAGEVMGGRGVWYIPDLPDGVYTIKFMYENECISSMSGIKLGSSNEEEEDQGSAESGSGEVETRYTLYVNYGEDRTIRFAYTSTDGDDKTSFLQIQLVDEIGVVITASPLNGEINLDNYILTGDVVCIVYYNGEQLDSFTVYASPDGDAGTDAGSSSDTGSSSGTEEGPSAGTGSDTGTESGGSDAPVEEGGEEIGDGENIDENEEGSGAGLNDGDGTDTSDDTAGIVEDEGSSSAALIAIIVVIIILVVALIVYFILAKMGVFGKNKKKTASQSNMSDDEDKDEDSSDEKEDEDDNDEEDYE